MSLKKGTPSKDLGFNELKLETVKKHLFDFEKNMYWALIFSKIHSPYNNHIKPMTDNKKLGIRLRHLEQHEPDRKRDLSPNTANRKKIFEKLPYQRVGER